MLLNRPTVVVADADPISRTILQNCLVDAGFPVRVAGTAEDVLVLCDMEPPDALIVDGPFPDMDAFELCDRVRHETRDFDVTVIFVMEVSDDMTRAYLNQMVDFAGGDYFVAKPCDTHWLIRLLDTIPRRKSTSSDRSRKSSSIPAGSRTSGA